MAGIKALVALAFSGSIGMTLVILACALPSYNNWSPFFVTFFYLLSPIPSMIARRYQEEMGSNNCKELALFVTAGIVVSAFGLPLILAHSPPSAAVIQLGACILTILGNIVTFLTILGFFLAFDSDDDGYSNW